MIRLLLLAPCVLWPALAGAWDLDPAASSLSVVSVKNGDVEEVHRFTGLTGAVADNGAALVAVALGSVETGIEVRDERMRTMLFDLAGHPYALVTTRLDTAAIEGLAAGASQTVQAPLAIEANGTRVETVATLAVTRLDADRVAVATPSPIEIDAARFGFGPGIERLRAVAGLDSISVLVPATAELVFRR